MARPKKPPVGRRYPLRTLQRRYEMLRMITLVLPLATFALWWFAPQIPWLAWADLFLLALVFVWLLVWVIVLLAPALCYVQCFPDYLYFASPFYRLKLSYGRITSTMTVNFGAQFPLARQSEMAQVMLKPLFREAKSTELSAVAVKIKKFSPSRPWLDFLFGKYLLLPREPGFVLVTPQWLMLSQEIDKYRAAWNDRRRYRKQVLSPASQILSR